ncbi:Ig-like domain-containing protein, partial [Actinomadura sp. HBU206391]|uniref:L,D-transpeptidase n=1 Tax=Actinomadura sp. HBU206391 TaxID=2731692 RepID=UPI0029058C53
GHCRRYERRSLHGQRAASGNGGFEVKLGATMPVNHRHCGRWAVGTALAMTLVLAGAACSIGDDQKRKAPPIAKLTITPGNGTARISPDGAIMVRVANGTLQDVSVVTKGNKVQGVQSGDGTLWRSKWTLDPGTKYHVFATALGTDGKTQSAMSSFTTQKAENPIATTIEAPADHETVGVGMPIVLHFDRDVSEKHAVERALEVRSSRPVAGAWHWFGDKDLVFRTKGHWPRHSKVELVAHMSGVRAAKNVFGTKNRTLTFKIGDEHSSVASEDDHQMVVKKNGVPVRTIPISMGRGGVRKYTTTNGNHLTMDKAQAVLMDSSTLGCGPGCPDYYSQMVYWAVRISNSGEYAHSAPWSVGSQGNSNVSHGCVNMSPSNAIWFFNFSYRGDPFKITGSSRELEPDNGWGYWQLAWPDWVKGSALKRPVTTDPIAAPPAPAPTPSARPGPSRGSGTASPPTSVTPGRTPSSTGTPGAPAGRTPGTGTPGSPAPGTPTSRTPPGTPGGSAPARPAGPSPSR